MIFLAKDIEEVIEFDGINVIVDFFRFSTTVAALCSRFKKIKVFDDEMKLFSFLTFNYMSVFSEKSLSIEKIDNSPYLAYTTDYSDEVAIITQSGSKAVMASKNAKEVVILSLTNLDSVKNYLKTKREDMLLVPACIFFNKAHVEDIIFCEYFLRYFNDNTYFDETELYNEILKTSRIDELLSLRETAKEDLKIIFSRDIFELVPIAKIHFEFAEVKYESNCKFFRGA